MVVGRGAGSHAGGGWFVKIMMMGRDRKIRHIVQIGKGVSSSLKSMASVNFAQNFCFFFSKKLLILFLMTPSIFPR